MSRLVRDQSGFSLIEVLIAASLMVVVLGAAIAPFQLLHRTEQVTTDQNEAQDGARNVLGLITRTLRNTTGQDQLVNLASPYDTSPKPSGSQNARNIMRLRYCLDTTSADAATTSGLLWEQAYRWNTAAPPATMPSTSCPDAGWGTRRVVATDITNRATSARRPAVAPVFTYYPGSGTLDTITSIRVSLYADRVWNRAPAETELTTGILLRNQNGAPTASFTATPGTAGSKKLTLNANTSTDPEGLPLTYRWCDVTTVTLCDDTTRVGTGVLYTYTAPAAGTRKIQLQAFDVGGLQATAGPLTVSAP